MIARRTETAHLDEITGSWRGARRTGLVVISPPSLRANGNLLGNDCHKPPTENSKGEVLLGLSPCCNAYAHQVVLVLEGPLQSS